MARVQPSGPAGAGVPSGPAGDGGEGDRRRQRLGLSASRQLGLTVVVGAAAAGLTLYAAARTWTVPVTLRPAPLPPLLTPRTGATMMPALPALAWVALAAAVALPATRGRGRLAVGALLAGCGLGLAVASGAALIAGTVDRVGWPILCLTLALVIAATGVVTLRSGRDWPGLGTRYDRAAPTPGGSLDRRPAPGTWTANPSAGTATGPGADPAGPVGTAGAEQVADPSTTSLWEAIDRGEDPTKG